LPTFAFVFRNQLVARLEAEIDQRNDTGALGDAGA
jgi:hypothetical protein